MGIERKWRSLLHRRLDHPFFRTVDVGRAAGRTAQHGSEEEQGGAEQRPRGRREVRVGGSRSVGAGGCGPSGTSAGGRLTWWRKDEGVRGGAMGKRARGPGGPRRGGARRSRTENAATAQYSSPAQRRAPLVEPAQPAPPDQDPPAHGADDPSPPTCTPSRSPGSPCTAPQPPVPSAPSYPPGPWPATTAPRPLWSNPGNLAFDPDPSWGLFLSQPWVGGGRPASRRSPTSDRWAPDWRDRGVPKCPGGPSRPVWACAWIGTSRWASAWAGSYPTAPTTTS